MELYLIAIYHCSRNRRNLPSGNNCPFVIDGNSKILPTPVANLSPVLATVDFVADVYRALQWSCIQLHPVRDQSKPLQTCRPTATGPFMVTEWVRNRPSNLLVVTGNHSDVIAFYHHRLLRHWQHTIKCTQYIYVKCIEIEIKSVTKSQFQQRLSTQLL